MLLGQSNFLGVFLYPYLEYQHIFFIERTDSVKYKFKNHKTAKYNVIIIKFVHNWVSRVTYNIHNILLLVYVCKVDFSNSFQTF